MGEQQVIARPVRMVWMMVRPPVALILLLFAAIGMAAAGRPDSLDATLVAVVAVVAGWFVHATVLNDRADEAIDRVNLPAAPARPLVSGLATRRQLLVLGNVAAAVSLAVALVLDREVAAVVTVGLGLSWAYSMPPLRISSRGAVASLLLPLGYVGLPFLTGWLAVRPDLDGHGLLVLAGLYVTFAGRIVLKDFRDVRGDALYGKRTFLLRHGIRATCRFSAACWVAGTASIMPLVSWEPVPTAWPRVVVTGVFVLYLAGALFALWRLARASGEPGERVAVAAVAVAGRAMAITVLALYAVANEGWPPGRSAAVLVALAAVFAAKYATTLAGPPVPAPSSSQAAIRQV